MNEARKAAHRAHVLVVEDDDDARSIYSAVLTHAGYAVETASSVKAAQAAVRARLPSIVVLDCHLPDGSGLTLLRSWRGTSPMSGVPVVMITAFSEPSYVDAATAAGADAFVVKPCTGDAFTSLLERVLMSAKPTRRIPRFRMSTRLDAPSSERRFQARCETCHRSSPVVGGLLPEAVKSVVALGWTTQRHGGFACPICRDREAFRPDRVTATRPRIVRAD